MYTGGSKNWIGTIKIESCHLVEKLETIVAKQPWHYEGLAVLYLKVLFMLSIRKK